MKLTDLQAKKDKSYQEIKDRLVEEVRKAMANYDREITQLRDDYRDEKNRETSWV